MPDNLPSHSVRAYHYAVPPHVDGALLCPEAHPSSRNIAPADTVLCKP